MVSQNESRTEVAIERVDEGNFDEFLGLVDELAAYERLDRPDEAARYRLRADGLSDHPKYEAYLGLVDGKPVAYLIYFLTYSSFLAMPTLYLEDIFVLEAYRRRGIGREMFGFCMERALEKGCGRMEWCVLDWNEPAIKFYEKNGAQRLEWTFFRMDRHLMEGRKT
jgi:GNAT superfamily N-acetyltransferase